MVLKRPLALNLALNLDQIPAPVVVARKPLLARNPDQLMALKPLLALNLDQILAPVVVALKRRRALNLGQ